MANSKISKKLITIGVIVLLAFILYGSVKGAYNNMVTLDENVSQQWAQVENVYQRRADLIPNLVNTVKGYAEHERETFEAVIAARAKASSVTIDPTNITPEALAEFQQAQNGLSSALSRLLVVVERYPDLKANQNFLELQAQLEGTENRIANERRKYAEVVMEYNANIRQFPRNIYAGIFGFDRKPQFEASEGAETAPVVEF
ncbi:MAG: LemA family protein [Bacteroidales bacterium]|jgi:LemA protein|nr:LemA family protein [Bacteroidales bacterium]NLM92989.1 LemA family protein [Bacteroidales bacterium]